MSDVHDSVRAFKAEVAAAVSTAMDRLLTDAGITPSAIDIDLIDVRTHGVDKRKADWAVGGVRVEFKL